MRGPRQEGSLQEEPRDDDARTVLERQLLAEKNKKIEELRELERREREKMDAEIQKVEQELGEQRKRERAALEARRTKLASRGAENLDRIERAASNADHAFAEDEAIPQTHEAIQQQSQVISPPQNPGLKPGVLSCITCTGADTAAVFQMEQEALRASLSVEKKRQQEALEARLEARRRQRVTAIEGDFQRSLAESMAKLREVVPRSCTQPQSHHQFSLARIDDPSVPEQPETRKWVAQWHERGVKCAAARPQGMAMAEMGATLKSVTTEDRVKLIAAGWGELTREARVKAKVRETARIWVKRALGRESSIAEPTVSKYRAVLEKSRERDGQRAPTREMSRQQSFTAATLRKKKASHGPGSDFIRHHSDLAPSPGKAEALAGAAAEAAATAKATAEAAASEAAAEAAEAAKAREENLRKQLESHQQEATEREQAMQASLQALEARLAQQQEILNKTQQHPSPKKEEDVVPPGEGAAQNTGAPGGLSTAELAQLLRESPLASKLDELEGLLRQLLATQSAASTLSAPKREAARTPRTPRK